MSCGMVTRSSACRYFVLFIMFLVYGLTCARAPAPAPAPAPIRGPVPQLLITKRLFEYIAWYGTCYSQNRRFSTAMAGYACVPTVDQNVRIWLLGIREHLVSISVDGHDSYAKVPRVLMCSNKVLAMAMDT